MELFSYILSQFVLNLLLYRKATDFCKLILYSTTLLKVYMMSRNFGVEFFGSLKEKIMLSTELNRTFSKEEIQMAKNTWKNAHHALP
jgi:hypothetical protein